MLLLLLGWEVVFYLFIFFVAFVSMYIHGTSALPFLEVVLGVSKSSLWTNGFHDRV